MDGHRSEKPPIASDLPLTAQHQQQEQPLSLSKMSFSQLPFHRDWASLPSPTLLNVKHLAREAGLFLLPSFISRRLERRSTTSTQPRTKTGIAALDGLRGLSCLIVFNEHYTANFTSSFFYGYGIEGRQTPIQLPPFRTFWAGSAMVAIFFVVSGYVLSYKPLRFIRSRSPLKFHAALTSSLFRRAVRLYLPSMAAVLICGLASYLGVFNAAARNAHNPDLRIQFHEDTPPRFDSFGAQMLDATKAAGHMFSLWSWGRDLIAPGDYDQHLWTINVEFRASIVLFLTLLLVNKLQQKWRLCTVVAFILYCGATDRRDVLLFLFGMLLAELDMIRKEKLETLAPARSLDGENEEMQRDARRKRWVVLFAAGFYLASAPVYGAEQTPGYTHLAALVPAFYSDAGIAVQAAGAVCMVWAVANSSHLKPLFSHPAAAYLGKISYALYLVHGNVIKGLLYAILPRLWAFCGAWEYSVGLAAAWMLGLVVVGPVTVWGSDLFERTVDRGSVWAARWLEGVMMEDGRGEAEKSTAHAHAHGHPGPPKGSALV